VDLDSASWKTVYLVVLEWPVSGEGLWKIGRRVLSILSIFLYLFDIALLSQRQIIKLGEFLSIFVRNMNRTGSD
jgi:hypothetical protein